MTKQDIIREGLYELLSSWYLTDDVLEYLHDNDVVLKVDGELPEQMFIEGYGYRQEHSAKASLDKVGYAVIEPLIK